MAASFNGSGADGKPPIIPETDGALVQAVVRTSEPAVEPRRSEYEFPGLSGAGSTYFGQAPAELRWDLHLVANSLSNLAAFEAKFKQYTGGAYRLVSELDPVRYWDYVELVRYEPVELYRVQGTDHWLRLARATFKWMQP